MTHPDSRCCAKEIICGDLAALHGSRRRHFRPAFLLALAAFAVFLLLTGVRSDLWEQPTWQIAMQLAAWFLGLLLFPMVGVGLWFPSRWVRLTMAIFGAGIAIVAATSWENSGGVSHGGGCSALLVALGLVFLGIGALSGAFAERRSASAPFWIAGGVALASLELATWVCPDATVRHVMPMHMLPAIGLVALVLAVAWHTRRKTR